MHKNTVLLLLALAALNTSALFVSASTIPGGLPVDEAPATEAAAGHLRFEYEDSSPRTLLASQVFHMTGRISVLLEDTDAAGVRVLMERAWVDGLVPDLASTHAYTVALRDDAAWYAVWVPSLETAQTVEVTTFDPSAQAVFTQGSPTTLRLAERPMYVSVLETPHAETRTYPADPAQGEVASVSVEHIQRLAVSFEDGNAGGQRLEYDAAWLSAMGFDAPEFRYEDGTLIPSYRAADVFVVEAPHFSIIYTFNANDEGWTKENPQPYSEISWNAAQGRLDIVANRRDPGDEIMQIPLPETFDTSQSFNVWSRFRITTFGSGQEFSPLFIASSGTTNVFYGPNNVGVYYTPTMIRLFYRDSTGNSHISGGYSAIVTNAYYYGVVDYDATTRTLTVKLQDSTNTDLVTDSWVVSATGTDGFTFGKIGVATNGNGGSSATAAVASVDKVSLVADAVPPIASGSQVHTWRNTPPALGTVSWRDAENGLAANAEYSIVTDGGTEMQPWTLMPVQPTQGQTSSWAPTWTPTAYSQGLNYVNVRVQDTLDYTATTQGAYQVQYDTGIPTADGASPIILPWAPTNPTLSTFCAHDGVSGLKANAAYYAVGSTQGSQDRLPWTLLGVQPVDGSTVSWCPNFQVLQASLAQGVNHVSLRLDDLAGNSATLLAYQIRYDTTAETVSGLSAYTAPGGNAILASTWQPDPTPYFAWNVSTSASPVAGYSYTLSLDATAQPDFTVDVTTPALAVTSPLADGSWTFKVRAIDAAGNVGSLVSFALKVDSVADAIATLTAKTSASGTTIPNGAWQKDNTPYWSWTTTASTSPVNEYSYSLSQDPTATPDTTVDTTQPRLDRLGLPLEEGVWYFRVSARDAAGNWGPASAPYAVGIDTVLDSVGTVSGYRNNGGAALMSTAWQNDPTPYFTWAPPPSTSPIVSYSYTLAQQLTIPDTVADTTTPNADFANAPMTQDGSWYFTVRSLDAAGNWGHVSPYFLTKLDTVADTVLVTSGTHDQVRYYNRTTFDASWEPENTPASPITGYSYALAQSPAPLEVDTVVDAGAATPSATFADLGSFGTFTLGVRALDEAGNWGPTRTYTFNIDAMPPTIFRLHPDPGSIVTDEPREFVEAVYRDRDGNHDLFELKTQVDVANVKLYVDGQDVIAMWGNICAPNGPVAACWMEVTTWHVRYDPLVPFDAGIHDVLVVAKDTVVDANTLTVAWDFTMYAPEGAVDRDQDRVPDAIEALICGRQAVRDVVNANPDLGLCESPDSYTPASRRVALTIPSGIVQGDDLDRDGVPKTVTVEALKLTIDPFQPRVVKVEPAASDTREVDEDDGDPNVPIASVIRSPVPVPIAATLGADSDGDGLPGGVTLAQRTLVFDRRETIDPVRLEPADDRFVQLDPDDGDRNNPIPYDELEDAQEQVQEAVEQAVEDAETTFDGFDQDADWIPDATEPLLSSLQDDNMPEDGTGDGNNYTPPGTPPRPRRV